MTREQVQRLQNGVYRVDWKGGGSSVATVGTLYDGTRFLCPSNWTSRRPVGVVTTRYWHRVRQAVRLA